VVKGDQGGRAEDRVDKRDRLPECIDKRVSPPFSLFVPTAVLAILALPLVLGIVPPNRIYGVRTPQTLADRAMWYSVNRFGGLALLASTAVTAGIYLWEPELASGRSFAGVLALVIPVIVSLLATGAYARSLARRNR
jgi:uncharacterized membrane protein